MTRFVVAYIWFMALLLVLMFGCVAHSGHKWIAKGQPCPPDTMCEVWP